MITVGQPFPEFKKQACIPLEKGEEFDEITNGILDNEVDRYHILK